MARRRLIVLGMLGGNPFAGIAWQVLHYLEGFRRLGCEVLYVEDTQAWPYDPERNAIVDDASFAARYLSRVIGRLDGPRWAYVSPADEVLGCTRQELIAELERADGLVNLSGATVLRDDYLGVPVRIYLETDPVLPQIELHQGRSFTVQLLEKHTHHFSFGEKLGDPDCLVPVSGVKFLPTRQPVVLDWWPQRAEAGDRYTTVASWRQTAKDLTWEGETYYWSKDREFKRFLDVPRRSGRRFELALSIDDRDDIRLLGEHGWEISDGLALSSSEDEYRSFIAGSHAEFTVAKDQNVRLRSGWFSDRSACYLACGRPVITQDTGFADVLPTGEGLFCFQTLEGILAAIEAIEGDYQRHRRAARAIAGEHFAAETVLSSLLERAGLG